MERPELQEHAERLEHQAKVPSTAGALPTWSSQLAKFDVFMMFSGQV